MIEMAVTVAIFGILLAAAAPGMGDWIRNAKINNAGESIQNGLQQARNAALGRNKPMSLYLVSDLTNSCTLSSSSGTWVVSAASPEGQCANAASLTAAPQIVAKSLATEGSSVKIEAKQIDGSTNATTVTFNGLGMLAQSSSATAARIINVTNASGNSYQRRVEVSLGGVFRMCEQNPSTTLANGDSRKCTQQP